MRQKAPELTTLLILSKALFVKKYFIPEMTTYAPDKSCIWGSGGHKFASDTFWKLIEVITC